MPKVLISDSMSNVAQKIFEKNKITVDVKTGLSEEEIREGKGELADVMDILFKK